MRVLYVEDEVLLAITVAASIEDVGFEVELAHDGQEGLDRARLSRPDLIVTDYMMPGMDGIQMIEALRREGIDAPAVLTTAIPEGQLQPGQLHHFAAYLGKPFDDGHLVEALRQLAAGQSDGMTTLS